ncbi:MAG: dihydropteroate synthase [Gemmataceae bacterium]
MSRFVWRLTDRELVIDRPLVMGIVNATPDSFSDGGQFLDPAAAVAHALDLVAQGADLLDIGGESTRPGSQPVSLDEELRRVVPVVGGLAAQTKTPISIDTSKAEVARQCIAAGAAIINDVSALRGDPAMAEVAQQSGAGVILMHMQGTPATMQQDPQYKDVIAEVYEFFEQRVRELTQFGLALEQLAVDPGIGFGKTKAHNLQLLAGLAHFQQLGRPVCLGVSRKGFIGGIAGRPPLERIAGSLAAACHALTNNAVQILRVHDIAPTADAVKVIQAINGSLVVEAARL